MIREPEKHTKKITNQVNLEKVKHIAKEQCSVKITDIDERNGYYYITFEFYDLDAYTDFYIKFGDALRTSLLQA